MPQRLPVFRAARLVGVSRNTLQKKIRQEGISTFEGSIDVSDLLSLYPRTDLGHDSEYERVQHIKASAFAKRVQERVLPDIETLAIRLSDLSHGLADSQRQLSAYQNILTQVVKRLSSIDPSQPQNQQQIDALLDWIKISRPVLNKNPDPEQDLLAHNTVLRIMSAHIKIQPSNHEFWLEGNGSLLEAAVQSGLSLNYGCTSGNCGLCKARIVSGEVKKIQNHDYVLSEAEKNMGYVLLCSCTAVSDVVIEALEAKDENDIPRQKITTKVKRIDQLNENIIALHLQTPRVQRLRFLAGQSVSLTLPDDNTVNLPVASCPCDDRNLVFHIDTNTDNETGNVINHSLTKGDEVIVNGPRGDFLLDENSKRTQLYIAYGTGFAPIKSLIEHGMAIDESASMHLYWVADKKEDLYLHNLCRSWSDALDNFHYHPALNTEPVKLILESHSNLNDCDVYLAGNEEKITRTKEKLLENGLPKNQISTNNLI
ncbi:MAG: 2Fe-2S iron-sulfur cluster-binding protein [Gammaproteobacteria bacterium]